MIEEIRPDDPSNPINDALSLPNTLRQWRSMCGWSQEDLERASGVSQKTISDIEAGRKQIKAQDGTLTKLADAFALASDMAPGAVLRFLKEARDRTPDTKVSKFAQNLDILLSGEPPAQRLFLEQSIMDHYFAQKKAIVFANSGVTKKSRRKKF